MKKYLLILDKFVASVLENLVTLIHIIITFFIFGQVIFRYVLRIPMGGIGELPIVLMFIAIWLAAAYNFYKDSHIEIRFIDTIIKNQKILKYKKILNRLVVLLSVSIFAFLSIDYTRYIKEKCHISPGLRFPQWWIVSVMAISSILMVFYTSKLFIKAIKETSK